MVRFVAVAGIALIAAGCGGPATHRPKDVAPADLEVRFDIDFTSASAPVEGELATFVVTIKNTGEYYVLLRNLEQEGRTVASWHREMPGSLQLRETADEFAYDPRERTLVTPAVFNTSLIVPGEEIIFKPRIRLLNLPREFALNYFAYGPTEVKNEVYFLENRDARPMKFRRITDDKLLEKALLFDPTVNVGSHRTVLFPHAEKVKFTPKRVVVKLDTPLDRRTFTRDQALAKAGLSVDDVRETSFCAGLDAWAFRTTAGGALVGTQLTAPLPRIDFPEVFCYCIVSAGNEALSFELRAGLATVVQESSPKFKILATKSDPNDKSRVVYTTLVRRIDLLEFLELVRTMGAGLAVSVTSSGFRMLVTR